MKILSDTKAFAALCEATRSYGLYISFSTEHPWAEAVKAAPYLSVKDNLQILFDGQGFILCDSYDEMRSLYLQTVGDDGPTKENPYVGPVRIYALTCGPDGVFMTENT